MITGEMKNKVDSIWDTIWTGGITSPITVLEQITYLMFMKLLDDNQLKAEANANLLGVPLKNNMSREDFNAWVEFAAAWRDTLLRLEGTRDKEEQSRLIEQLREELNRK